MGKRRRRPVFCALSIGCAVLAASPTWAAVVQPGSGNLTINQGQGFKPVTSASNANVGDSVMVGPGGSATVVYEDGCKVNVQPGAVTTIAALSPCAAGSKVRTTLVPSAPTAGPTVTTTGVGGLPAASWQLGSVLASGKQPKRAAIPRHPVLNGKPGGRKQMTRSGR
jgi:hypothetical protein